MTEDARPGEGEVIHLEVGDQRFAYAGVSSPATERVAATALGDLIGRAGEAIGGRPAVAVVRRGSRHLVGDYAGPDSLPGLRGRLSDILLTASGG